MLTEAAISPAPDPPRTPTKSPPHKKKKKNTPKKDSKKAQTKPRKGKTDRAKLVERLMFQNMRTWEMLDSYGIMDSPKDLANLEKFIKQGTRTALRQARDTQLTLDMLNFENEAIQHNLEQREMAWEEARSYRVEMYEVKKEWSSITEARKKQLADNKAAGVELAERMATYEALHADAEERRNLNKELMKDIKQKLAQIASRGCVYCGKTTKETEINFAICDGCVHWKGESDKEEQST